MRIVYAVNKEGVSTVMERLGTLSESEKTSDRNLAIRLMALINHAAEHGGIVSPPQGKKLDGYPFSELRQKHGRDLLRICYFTHREDKLVLLHIFEKPDGKASEKIVAKELAYANHVYNLYLSNPKKHAIQ